MFNKPNNYVYDPRLLKTPKSMHDNYKMLYAA